MSLAGRVLGAAFLVGVGAAAIIVVAAAPQVLRVARPIAREGLKRGMKLYDRARGAVAELADDFEDLVAEVKADLTAQPSAAPPPAGEDSSAA